MLELGLSDHTAQMTGVSCLKKKKTINFNLKSFRMKTLQFFNKTVLWDTLFLAWLLVGYRTYTQADNNMYKLLKKSNYLNEIRSQFILIIGVLLN